MTFYAHILKGFWQVPRDGEEVLVRIGSECNLAIYDAKKEEFYIKKFDKRANISQVVIFWMRLEPPI